MDRYFSSKRSLYHYISMAEGNYRDYLKGDTVRAKKYLYVLRPVLACKWILEKQTHPPMLFSELAGAELPEYMKGEVDRLLYLKMNSPEIREIPKMTAINAYLDAEITKIKETVMKMPEEAPGSWEKLNTMFLSQLK